MVKINQHAFDQIQFIKYHKKEQNKSLNQFKEKKLNSANTEQLGQYRKTRPIRVVLAEFFRTGQVFLYWLSFSILAEFVIGMMRADLAIQILY